MSNATPRRRHVGARCAGAFVAAAVAGSGFVAAGSVAVAEEAVPTTTMKTFEASAFTEAAAELPDGLHAAVERDLGISAAQYLANAEAAQVAVTVLDGLEVGGVEVGAAQFDADGQLLEVYVEDDADRAAVEAAGATVLDDKPAEHEPADDLVAYEDLKGGYGYGDLEADGSFGGRCSTGFNGFGAEGQPVVLTAGHCGTDATDVTQWHHLDVPDPIQDGDDWPRGAHLGNGGIFQFGEGHDAGLFPVANPAWTTPPTVSTWSDGQGNPREGEVVVTDHTDPIVGQPICRSGATTGWHCGETLQVDYPAWIEDHDGTGYEVNVFVTDACSLQGDSGGSFVSGTAAVGTLTGGPTSTTVCDGTQREESMAYAVSGSEFSAEQFYGDNWELNVHVNDPVVTPPESGRDATFTGTVEGAGEHHRVSVAVDGGEPVEGDVSADGTFTVPVGELEPGEHSYVASAHYGEHSHSAEVEDVFTIEEEPEIEGPAVESPEPGATTDDPRASFAGTGHPGAQIELLVDDESLGSTTVAEDGAWELTPEADLPVGSRTDVQIRQVFEDDEQEVVVEGIGVRAPEVTVTAPEQGDEVSGETTFTGTAHPGSDVVLSVEGEPAGGDSTDTTLTAADGQDSTWEGEFEFGEDGTWTFTPAEPLPAGEFTLTAEASIGGDEELGSSTATVDFTVASDDEGDEAGSESGGEDGGDESGDAGGTDEGDDEDLPDTGASTLPFVLTGLLLAGAGTAAVATRTRRASADA